MRPSLPGRRALPKGVLAGLAGTTAMTATLGLEKALRRNVRGPVDYDASPHVVTAASAVLRWKPRTGTQRRALFLLVHWGYGSAVAGAYPLLRSVSSNDVAAGAAFYAGCQSMAMTLFPTLGGTPPPWRWRKDIFISSLVQHAVYSAVVAAAWRRLSQPRLYRIEGRFNGAAACGGRAARASGVRSRRYQSSVAG